MREEITDAANAIMDLPADTRQTLAAGMATHTNAVIAELGEAMQTSYVNGDLGSTLLAIQLAGAVRRGHLDGYLQAARASLPESGALWGALRAAMSAEVGAAEVAEVHAMIEAGWIG